MKTPNQMNRRGFIALLTAPFVAKLLPRPATFTHSTTLQIIGEHTKQIPFTVSDHVMFLSEVWADKLRAENNGVLPERYLGFKIVEVQPFTYASR